MGNTACCQDLQREEDYTSIIPQQPIESLTPSNFHNREQEKVQEQRPKEEPVSVSIIEENKIEIPILASNIKERVEAEGYFADKLKGDLRVRRFGDQIYEGQLDERNQFPHGIGRMYKSDGSFYVGHFQHGKAEGEGAYLTPNGLVYRGHFHNNLVQGEGKYEAKGVTYSGHFLKNLFHGAGKEGSADYEFEGEFYEGKKTHGVFKWVDKANNNYIYTGHFDFNNQFHGQGLLSEPSGTYSGSFINGIKDGNGIYKYHNGLRYEGQYRKGLKQGKGIIYNFNNSIAYEGEFDNDMPHGKGYIYDSNGNRHATTWDRGIDTTFI